MVKPLKSNVNAASTIESSPVNEVAPVVVADRLSLQMISSLVKHTAFSADEKKAMLATLQDKASDRKRNRYGYDIDVSFSVDGHDGKQLLSEGVIQLSSKSFGYDFALMKIVVGHTLFGSPKQVVKIYRSGSGEDEYAFLQAAPNLAKAIGLIDKMYCQAAELHLA